MLGGHLEAGGGGRRLGEVGEVPGARQVRDIAGGVVEVVRRDDEVAVVGVLRGVVDGGLRHRERLLGQDLMGVRADRDPVVARLEDVGLGVLGVVGGQGVPRPRHRHGLRLAGLEQLRLLVGDQVRRRLLNAAVGVGRVRVDLDDVLARDLAGVRHRHLRAQHPVGALPQFRHLLGETRVGQAVAEGVDDFARVLDDALSGGGLVPAVAHVDGVRVVDERRLGERALVEGVLLGELSHVRVLEVAEVVGGGARLDDPGEGVGGLGRRVDLAVQDAAQGVEAHLPARDRPDDRVDVRVVLQLAELEDVRGVDDDDRLLRVLLGQRDHVPLGAGELQVALPVLEVRVLGGVVRVREIGVLAGLLVDVAGQVEALAAAAGDGDDRGVGEGPHAAEQVVGVHVLGRLGQRPVGLEHADLGALGAVAGVQRRQVGVRREARVRQAVQQGGRRVVGGQGSRARPAVDGVRRAPPPHVDRGPLLQGQRAVRVLQQDHPLVGDVVAQPLHLGLRGVGEGPLPGGEVEDGAETAVHHRHDGDDDGHEGGDPHGRPREFARGTVHSDDGDGDDDGERQRDADDDQGDLDRLNHLPHVIPVDGKHVRCSSFRLHGTMAGNGKRLVIAAPPGRCHRRRGSTTGRPGAETLHHPLKRQRATDPTISHNL